MLPFLSIQEDLMINQRKKLLISGALLGLSSIILVVLGNPGNMGLCIACFLRDIVGALHIHPAQNVSYMRPEILGIVLAAFIVAVLKKEFRPRGGSNPVLRFLLGAFMMIGALVFLGCPVRMVLRLAAGDMNALVALVGFSLGVAAGSAFLNQGFSLGRSKRLHVAFGLASPALFLIFLFILLFFPVLLVFGDASPAANHAPVAASLFFGAVVGIASQRSRMCMAGGIRDLILLRDPGLIMAPIAMFVVALVGNVVIGKFNFGFAGQPIAHTDGLWNFLSMFLVGLCAVMLGGCPLRQLILSSEGDFDAFVTVVGLMAGAAVSHNFGAASSANGTTSNGRILVVAGLVFALAVAVLITLGNRRKENG